MVGCARHLRWPNGQRRLVADSRGGFSAQGEGSWGFGVIKFAIQSVRMTLEEDMLTYG